MACLKREEAQFDGGKISLIINRTERERETQGIQNVRLTKSEEKFINV